MATYTNQIELVNMDGLSDFERIDRNLRALIVSVERTLPGSRSFGLPAEYISDIPESAASGLAEALDEKCETYIPEISISGVDFEANIDGTLTITIYVERRYDS